MSPIIVPKGKQYNVQTLTPDQTRALLEAARDDRLKCALWLELSLGLRASKVCGLQWSDVDFENGMLHIRSTVQYINGQGLVRGEPKTESSRRSIKLPAMIHLYSYLIPSAL